MSDRCTVDFVTPPSVDEREGAERLARYAKALGHPARIAIMRMLLRLDACFAGAIADALPQAASTVSQHLRQLKDAGLIQGDIDGPRICYCVNRAALAELKGLVADLGAAPERAAACVTPTIPVVLDDAPGRTGRPS